MSSGTTERLKGTGFIGKTVASKKGGQENILSDETQELDISPELTDGTKVAVGFGFTKNLGNFESARVEIRIELPTTKNGASDTFEVAKKFVEERMEIELTEIEKLKEVNNDFQ